MAKNKDGSDNTVDEQPSILDGSGLSPEAAAQEQGAAQQTYNDPGVEVSSQPPHLRWYEGRPEPESHLYQEATFFDAGGTVPTYGPIENEYDDGTVEVRTPFGLSPRLPLELGPADQPRGYTVYLGHASGPQVKEEEVKKNDNANTNSN